jgi:hypothetical protein
MATLCLWLFAPAKSSVGLFLEGSSNVNGVFLTFQFKVIISDNAPPVARFGTSVVTINVNINRFPPEFTQKSYSTQIWDTEGNGYVLPIQVTATDKDQPNVSTCICNEEILSHQLGFFLR